MATPFLLLIVFLFSMGRAEAAFYKPTYNIYTIKTEHFYIHYPQEVGNVAKDVAELSEKVYAKLSPKLNWDPWGRTHIVVVDAADEANGMATVIPANYMLLRVTPPDAGSSLDSYTNYLELLITHEFTHILHIDMHHGWATPFRWLFGKIVAPNGLAPGWMREGMAAWEESVETGLGRANSTYSEMYLRSAIYDDDFPHIDEVAGLSPEWPGSNSQYIFGVKFWQWIAEKYGDESITKYMKKYSSGLWLFSLNNKAKKVYGKSFYKLWKEWQADLQIKYAKEKSDISDKGLTPFTELVKKKEQLTNILPHPSGTGYAYMQQSLDEPSRIMLDFNPGQKPKTIGRILHGQMAFSRDGGSLLSYASISGVEKYSAYSDVFFYDTTNKKVTRAYEKGNSKKSLRAMDPDFSPADGGRRWVVMVRTNLGTDNLYVYDKENRAGYYLTDVSKYIQFSNPRYSPDGNQIVVSRHDHEGHRDIVLYSKTGELVKKITDDKAVDNYPIWSPDGQSIYFESDSSGIANIYRYDVASGVRSQVTNVLTGVFAPQLSPDGTRLYVTYYTSKGTHLAYTDLGSTRVSLLEPPSSLPMAFTGQEATPIVTKSDFDTRDVALEGVPVTVAPSFEVEDSEEESFEGAHVDTSVTASSFYSNSAAGSTATRPINESAGYVTDDDAPTTTSSSSTSTATGYAEQLAGKSPPTVPDSTVPGAKKYSAFPQLLVPRYLVPTFATLDDAFLFGLSIGKFDPLYRHAWNAYASYRTDVNFVGGGANYAYTRYFPTFYVGAVRYALNWGNIFGTGEDFFERRLQGYAGMAVSIPHHGFSFGYFFEDRQNLTTIPAGFVLPNLDYYAGIRANYVYSQYSQYPNSISQEKGAYVKIGVDITDSVFGSADTNEQQVLTGDFRYYFEMPWSNHHVFGIRAAGGVALGDDQFSGTFRFGGPFGEGSLAGYSDRLFPFRGLPGITFNGDRALLFSGEYRLPIAKVNRGIGTWPIFLNQIHLAGFTDYGNVWYQDFAPDGFFDDFLLGVGAELRANMMIGYGLPVTARLGYAVVLMNRDRIAGLSDSLTGIPVEDGTLYFQFGTSF